MSCIDAIDNLRLFGVRLDVTLASAGLEGLSCHAVAGSAYAIFRGVWGTL